jgi:hypothetical protein
LSLSFKDVLIIAKYKKEDKARQTPESNKIPFNVGWCCDWLTLIHPLQKAVKQASI